MTWLLRLFISPAISPFDQKVIQANNKDTIKALHYWPFVGESIFTSGFPTQKTIIAESMSRLWCHHEKFIMNCSTHTWCLVTVEHTHLEIQATHMKGGKIWQSLKYTSQKSSTNIFCQVHTGERGWYSLQLFLYQNVSLDQSHTFCNQIKLPTAVTKPHKTMENILNQIDIFSGSVICYVSRQVPWILTKTWIYMKNKRNLLTFICKIHR